MAAVTQETTGAHRKLHGHDNHEAGTARTVFGTNSGGALAEIEFHEDVNNSYLVQRTATGHIKVPTNGQAASEVYSKQQIDNLLDGKAYKDPSRAATTAALPAVTYANGTAGVGATLTADANGALPSQDGVSLAANDRLLVKDQAAGLQNGIYEVTQLGDAGNPFILTRASDNDTDAEQKAATTTIEEGTANGDKQFTQTADSVTMGTTALTWVQSDAGSINFINGLEKVGNDASIKPDVTGGANLATVADDNANGLAIRVDDTTIEDDGGGASGQLRVKDGGVTPAKTSFHKAKVNLAGATPAKSDFSGTLTTEGDFAFGEGTTGRAFLAYAMDVGTLEIFSVELSQLA